MQLVAYGAQDVYLTGNPQITFFKVVYRRHTNFSMEAIQQTINGSSGGGGSGTVTISRNGDLVHKVYVVNNTASLPAAAAPAVVTDGQRIFDVVDLEIGGQLIDRQNWLWREIYLELTTPESKANGVKAMTYSGANGPRGRHTMATQGDIVIPLHFWFCNNPGLALPLIALQYHEVKIKINWGTAGTGNQVWCDYIYLDTDERRRFAQVSHEYLIEQVQMQAVVGGATTQKLNFNHPVKELIWTSPAGRTYQNARLTLNGHDRFATRNETYFQMTQPHQHHTSIPGTNVEVFGRPVMVAPIVSLIVTHNLPAAVNNTIATLSQTNLTVDALRVGDFRVGDILKIARTGTNDNPPISFPTGIASTVLFRPVAAATDVVLTGVAGVTNLAPAHFAVTATVNTLTISRTANDSFADITDFPIGQKISLTLTSTNATDVNGTNTPAVNEIYFATVSATTVRNPAGTQAGTLTIILANVFTGSGAAANKTITRIQGTGDARFRLHLINEEIHRENTVQIASISAARVLTFTDPIPANLFTTLVNGETISVHTIGRIQDPLARCSAIANKINCYSFALKPEEHQPSGTCNFSRIDTARLETGNAINAAADGALQIYAVNYNVLRIMSGMGGLAYSN